MKEMEMSFLDDVVDLSIRALQQEDSYIRDALSSRKKMGGLVRLRNERYYQFVTWRAALSKWDAIVERGYRDMIISDDQGRDHIFEMKNWRSESTALLEHDVRKLQMCGGYFMVFSDNPPELTCENVKIVSDMILTITGEIAEPVLRKFDTCDTANAICQFWLGAWEIPRRVVGDVS